MPNTRPAALARVRLLASAAALPLALAAPASSAAAQDASPAADTARPAAACASPGVIRTAGLLDPKTALVRAAEIRGQVESGPSLLRRWSDAPVVTTCGHVPGASAPEATAGPSGLELELVPARLETGVNTGYPVDRNNGAAAGARGLSTALSGGVRFRWGAVSGALAPQVVYEQNAEFPVSALGRNDIDWPHRLGTGDFAILDPGQSYLRADAYGAAAGVSTENLWIGSGLGSSVLLTTTAPGFPHAFLGTGRPVDVWVGRLEAEMIWGRLAESWDFDDDPDNDDRLLSGIVLGLEPRGAPGLTIGIARLFLQYDDGGLGLGDYVPFLGGLFGQGLEQEGAQRDEFVAFYARWVLPESGFEVFGEWVKYDGNADFHDVFVEPDNGSVYMMGLQKVWEVGPDWVRLYGEIVNLNPTLPILHRNSQGNIYRHYAIVQGHTNRGQLLGAWIGPGSDSQTLGGELITDWGGAGLFVERVRRSVDVYYQSPTLQKGYPLKHDAELTGGATGAYLWRDFRVDATAAYSHRRNRDFLPPEPDELERGYRVDSSWRLELAVGWYPGAALAGLLGR